MNKILKILKRCWALFVLAGVPFVIWLVFIAGDFFKSKFNIDIMVPAAAIGIIIVAVIVVYASFIKTKEKYSVSEEEINYQVTNYNNLSLTQSYRGAAVTVLVILSLISIFVSIFFNGESILATLIYIFLFYLPLGWFMYKGNRWAFVSFIILFSLERAYSVYQISTSGNGVVQIQFIIWVIVISFFIKALMIESKRAKLKN